MVNAVADATATQATQKAGALQERSAVSRVALMREGNRFQTVLAALEAISFEVDPKEVLQVLVKPNLVSARKHLAATHVDATRAVLTWLRRRFAGKVIVAEGPAIGSAEEGFRNFGYLPLIKEFGVELRDLNRDEWEVIEVFDRQLRPMSVRVARTVLESDFRIAVGPPKTHGAVIVTLSLKNLVMGSLIRERQWPLPWLTELPLLREFGMWLGRTMSHSDKIAIHQGYPVLNLNLCTLAKQIYPHLSVIDGWVGMQGDGPVYGEAVQLGWAVASTDFLAADATAARLIGFDPHQIGYLYYCALGGLGKMDPEDIALVGNLTLEEVGKQIRPHRKYRQQLEWSIPDVETYLQKSYRDM